MIAFAGKPTDETDKPMNRRTVFGCLLLAAAQNASGQAPGLLTGIVRSASGPVVEAAVFLDGGRETRTDSAGAFSFRNVRVGDHTVEARSIGLAPLKRAFAMTAGDTVRVELVMEKITALDSMLIEGSTIRLGFVRAYEDRKRLGLGQFLDSTQVRNFAMVGQAVSFMRSVHYRNGIVTFGTERCLPNVWIDRVNWGRDQGILRTMAPSDVMAVEVYTRSVIPEEFRPRGRDRTCGALVIWTRRLWPQGKGK